MDNESIVDPYKVLGVPRDATGSVIRGSYIALAREHERGIAGQDLQAARAFQKIADAYHMVNTPVKRAETDRRLDEQEAGKSIPAGYVRFEWRGMSQDDFADALLTHSAMRPGGEGMFAVGVALNRNRDWKQDPKIIERIVSLCAGDIDRDDSQLTLFNALDGKSEAQTDGLANLLRRMSSGQGPSTYDAANGLASKLRSHFGKYPELLERETIVQPVVSFALHYASLAPGWDHMESLLQEAVSGPSDTQQQGFLRILRDRSPAAVTESRSQNECFAWMRACKISAVLGQQRSFIANPEIVAELSAIQADFPKDRGVRMIAEAATNAIRRAENDASLLRTGLGKAALATPIVTASP